MLESLNLYGSQQDVEEAIEEIRHTVTIHNAPAYSRLMGGAVLVVESEDQLEVETVADAFGVEVVA